MAVSRISQLLNMVPSVITMFESPTAFGLAMHVESLQWASDALLRGREESGEGFEVGEI